jgi:hypothetical protein
MADSHAAEEPAESLFPDAAACADVSPARAGFGSSAGSDQPQLLELDLMLREPWLPRADVFGPEASAAASCAEGVLRRIDELRQCTHSAAADAIAAREAVEMLLHKSGELEKVFAMVDSVEAVVQMMKASVAQMEKNVDDAEKKDSSFPMPSFFASLTVRVSLSFSCVVTENGCVFVASKVRARSVERTTW